VLPTFVLNAFSKPIVLRGRQYHASGAVNVHRVTSTLVEATIDGNDRYQAAIALERGPRSIELICSCTCPYCTHDGLLCKHLFALFAEVDAVYPHFLIGLPTSTLLTVDPDDQDDTGDNHFDMEAAIRRALPHTFLRLASTRLAPPESVVRSPPPAPPRPRLPPPAKLPWHKFIEAATARIASRKHYSARKPSPSPAPISPIYLLATSTYNIDSGLVELGLYEEKRAHTLLTFDHDPLRLEQGLLPPLLGHEHQAIAAQLTGCAARVYSSYYDPPTTRARFALDPDDPAVRDLLRAISATGRLHGCTESLDNPRNSFPLTWIEGPPWRGVVSIAPSPQLARPTKAFPASDPADPLLQIALAITRDGERRELAKTSILAAGGKLLIENQTIQHVDLRDLVEWDDVQRETRAPLTIKRSDLPTFLRSAETTIGLPDLALSPQSGITRLEPLSPTPRIELKLNTNRVTGVRQSHSRGGILGSISVLYGPHTVDPRHRSATSLVDSATKLLPRDPDAESRFLRRAADLGLRPDSDDSTYTLAIKRLPEVVAALLADGWSVHGDRALYRRPGKTSLKVSPSGLDWFGITGGVMFDGQEVPFPALLEAVNSGNRFVKLGDGSLGMLPDEWLKRHAGWMRLGSNTGVDIRFSRAQIGLIDTLLDELPEATCDEQVTAARDRLHSFDGICPVAEPASFTGELRPYQREGLGWLDYLHAFGFGGCLADDMGLGKTVQLLAHVASLKERGQTTPPPLSTRATKTTLPTPSRAWLIIAPRSLIFNWIREAQRFTTSLEILDFAGPARTRLKAKLATADLVFTTYGLLRTDIELLRGFEFAGVVLDEAQAIKNPQSASAKAARLLHTRRRIAMTGTPVENHLGDLWSIFEFLNPGLLGALPAFRAVIDPKPLVGSLAQLDPISAALEAANNTPAPATANPEPAAPKADLALIRSAVRPFILRRTKQQVATDLPSRTEQTIECVLRPPQRTLYNDLAAHYRESILGRVDRDGMNKSRMHVLEALLRLRQAACHPALINPAHAHAGSAKIESLLAMLEEATDTGSADDATPVPSATATPRGHKALVFSQFTSMLALVKTALDTRAVRYEYLDGQTTDRAARVDRFQADPDLRVFLISLKAGGSGLNLTAADYVFILDPWWNPAVEAQAIDRAHRLGQTKNVFAYRLIAKDTIEERIADLQRTKRDLARAIMDEDAAHSLAASLTRDDLAALFQ